MSNELKNFKSALLGALPFPVGACCAVVVPTLLPLTPHSSFAAPLHFCLVKRKLYAACVKSSWTSAIYNKAQELRPQSIICLVPVRAFN